MACKESIDHLLWIAVGAFTLILVMTPIQTSLDATKDTIAAASIVREEVASRQHQELLDIQRQMVAEIKTPANKTLSNDWRTLAEDLVLCHDSCLALAV